MRIIGGYMRVWYMRAWYLEPLMSVFSCVPGGIEVGASPFILSRMEKYSKNLSGVYLPPKPDTTCLDFYPDAGPLNTHHA
jgi:hypothetical protein